MFEKFYKKYEKYLPSKGFIKKIGFLLIFLLLIVLIFSIFNKNEVFSRKKKADLAINKKTVTDLMNQDTDLDGVLDWEESLWGTDKNNKYTNENISDLEYINNKKKELNINQEIENIELTETEKFARQFFSAYTALKSEEGIDSYKINNFSNALGQKIVNPVLSDIYSLNQIKIGSKDTKATKNAYYLKLKSAFEEYSVLGFGDELTIVSNNLISYDSTGQSTKQEELLVIGQAYKDFAQKIMEFSVPISLTTYHLNIANSSNNIGENVLKMSEMINDPLVGLSALSSYQKYNDDLIKSVKDLQDFLVE